MAEIQSVLRPLEHFETLMQEIYAKLAQRFGGDADAAALFTRLAFEERSHVGQVQFLRRIARQNPSHFSDVDVDLVAIRREVEQIERVHAAIDQLSLREAVVLSIEFESGVAEVHSRPAIAGSNRDMGTMLRSLHNADLKHHTSLVEFARKRGFRTG